MQTATIAEKPRKQAISGRFWAGRTYRGRIKDDHKIDGACGTGGMLTVAQDRLQTLAARRSKSVSIHLFGQEINPETFAICKADMLLKGDGDQAEHISFGSTLSSDGNPSRQFDFMLSNPPYGKSWKTDADKLGGKKEILDSRFNAYLEGGELMPMIPRTSDGQLLFLLNNVAKMKKDMPLGSRIAEVHNGSSIFTGDAGSGESNARRYLIEHDLVEAIDVDVVFVIDRTIDMRVLMDFKRYVLEFGDALNCCCNNYNLSLGDLRYRFIEFWDFYSDRQDLTYPPIEASVFFDLPFEREELAAFLDRLKTSGKGDGPDSALEALHLAFNSDWKQTKQGVKNRQVIILLTDAPSHRLDDPMRNNSKYNMRSPLGMPESLEELEDEYMSSEVFPSQEGMVLGHRLILFAPEDEYPWNDMSSWEAAVCITPDNRGIAPPDGGKVFELICRSMAEETRDYSVLSEDGDQSREDETEEEDSIFDEYDKLNRKAKESLKKGYRKMKRGIAPDAVVLWEITSALASLREKYEQIRSKLLEQGLADKLPVGDSPVSVYREAWEDWLRDEDIIELEDIDYTTTELPISPEPVGIPYNLDVVFVIDCTGDMKDLLDKVKQHVLHFEDGLRNKCESRGLGFRISLRIRIIGFRDFYYDWEDPNHPPVEASAFFNIPEQHEELAAFLDRLEAAGGEDEPESGLEALHLAFHSDWKQPESGTRDRQLIILYTNSKAHPLDDPMRYDQEFNSHYPVGMPKSLEELQEEYCDPEVFPSRNGPVLGHRLILFVPENEHTWESFWYWDCSMVMSIKGSGGNDIGSEDLDAAYNMIFMS